MNEQIKKYLKLAFSRIWILLILTVLSAGVVYVSRDSLFRSIYQADMKIIITLNNPNTSSISVFDSIRSSQLAVGDISQIIDSDAVLTEVEKECGLGRLEVLKALTIDAIPNTRIIGISVETGTPEGSLKLMESLERNLNLTLRNIDSSITYKILSKPDADTIPANRYQPYIFTVIAAFGGFVLGVMINLIIGERNLLLANFDYVNELFKGENILLLPKIKLPKREGGVL